MVIVLISLAAAAAVKGYRKHKKTRQGKVAAEDDHGQAEITDPDNLNRIRNSRRNFTTNRAQDEADPPPPYIANDATSSPPTWVASGAATEREPDMHPSPRQSEKSYQRDSSSHLIPYDGNAEGRRRSDVSSTDVPAIMITPDGRVEMEVDSDEEALALDAELDAERREWEDTERRNREMDDAAADGSPISEDSRRGRDERVEVAAPLQPDPLIPIPSKTPRRSVSPGRFREIF